MAKEKTIYTCTFCGKPHLKWSGRCEGCGEWNCLKEEKQIPITSALSPRVANKAKYSGEQLAKFSPAIRSKNKTQRLTTGIKEFDRVLGGGFFPGSIILMTGDPGIGKSTLSLQAAIELAKQHPDKKILLISGEESVEQISDRMFRIEENPPKNLLLLAEGILEHALQSISEQENIGFLLFDSVQTLSSLDINSAPGSITQSVAVTERLMMLAKQKNIPTLLIGHVTKNGEMAGPQTMAHLVDGVLHIEGEKFSEYRILRSRKNRFGSVFEMGVFEMTEIGLSEVKNPSKNFLSGRLKNAEGSSIFTAIEGTRPFLVEIQALSKYSSFGYPKRSTSGFDINRLSILIAVMGKHMGIKLENEDIFVNIAGGLKISEPAADLAVMAALLSSKKKISLPENTIFCGEIGLSGEVRQVANLSRRLEEAEKLGFTKAVIPYQGTVPKNISLECIRIKTVQELLGLVQ